MSSEKELKDRAARSSQLLRTQALSLPPEQPGRDVREGVAASAELSILILQKLGQIHLQQAEQAIVIKQLVQDSARFSDVIIDGHRSRLELDEEITRADLDLRRLKVRRTERIWMRIFAGVLAPPAMFQFWEWMKLLLQ